MPGRGWTTAPDGWVRPRPPSHRWPMAQGNRQPPAQEGRRSVRPPAQVQVGQGPVHPQRRPESKPSVVRPDPDSTREAARIRVMKLGKALEVDGGFSRPCCGMFPFRVGEGQRRGDDQSTSRSTSAASSLPDQRRGSSTWTRNEPESDCNAWKPSKHQIRLHHLRKRSRPQIGKAKWMF